MKIYLPDKHELDAALVHPLRQIIDLYGAGVLGDNSQVWVDPKDGVLPMFWALTDRSSLVFVLETHVPGWVRITDKRIRWARTYDGTTSDSASPDLHLAELSTPAGKPLGVDAVNNFTFVVQNLDRSKPVGVIEDSKNRDMIDGYYFSPSRGVTVIDAAHFKPSFSYAWQDPNEPESWISGTEPPDGFAPGQYFKLHRDPTPYEKSHAMVQGTELITRRLPPPQRNIVRSNIDEHGIEVLPDTLTAIEEKTRGVYLQFAQSTLMTLRQQLGAEERLYPATDDEPTADAVGSQPHQATPPAAVISELTAQAE